MLDITLLTLIIIEFSAFVLFEIIEGFKIKKSIKKYGAVLKHDDLNFTCLKCKGEFNKNILNKLKK